MKQQTQNSSRQIPLLFSLLLLVFAGQAQKAKDNLTVCREFIEASNIYKQLPLQLRMELKQSSNIITAEKDTTSLSGEYFLSPAGSYIHFGELEQFVTDSLALLVSGNLKRMILFSDARIISAQLLAMTGLPAKDSNALDLSVRFTATATNEMAGRKIVLTGRSILPGTSMSIESVELLYKPDEKKLLQVVTIKRSLIPLNEGAYNSFKAKPEAEGKLIQVEGKGWFLMKEQQGAFIYKSITHEDTGLPATVADRIKKNGQGEFEPVKQYADYAITLN